MRQSEELLADLKGQIGDLAELIRKYKAFLMICTDEPLRVDVEKRLSEATAKSKARKQALCEVTLLDLCATAVERTCLLGGCISRHRTLSLNLLTVDWWSACSLRVATIPLLRSPSLHPCCHRASR